MARTWFTWITAVLLGPALPTQVPPRAAAQADLAAWVDLVLGDKPELRLQAWEQLLQNAAAAAPVVCRALPRVNLVNPFAQRAARNRTTLVTVPRRRDPDARLGGSVAAWLANRFQLGVPDPVASRLLGRWVQFEPDDDFVVHSTQPEERLLVLCGLMHAHCGNATSGILTLLEGSDGRQLAAVWTLERIGAPALPLVLERLGVREGHDLLVALLLHLAGRVGRAAPVEAARVVVSFLDDSVSLVRGAAFHALLQLGRGAVPELMNALRDARAPRRCFALMALCRIARGTELANILTEACGDADAVVRDYATTAAGHLFATGALGGEHAAQLATRLATLPEELRPSGVSLLITLAAFGPHARAALPALQQEGVDDNSELHLLRLLLQVRISGDKAAARELVDRLQQGPAERALVIVDALAAVPAAALPAQTQAALERTWARFAAHTAEAAAVRLAVLRVLAEWATDTPQLRTILAETSQTMDFDLCVTAAVARARLDGERVVAELIADLQAGHSFDRRVAACVLGRLAVPTATAALTAALAGETHAPTADALKQALAEIARRGTPR